MTSTKLFRTSEQPTPPADLLGKVFARIKAERARAWRFKIATLITASVAAFTALAAALAFAITSFTRSGASAFLKLMITDTGIVTAYWQDFAYSLLETIPTGELAASLASGAAAAIVLRSLIRTVRKYHQPHAFTI